MQAKRLPGVGVLLVTGLLLSTLGSATVHLDARDGIEMHRKGNGTVVVRLPDGAAVAGAKVHLRQTSHSFLFGNYFRPRHYDNEAYRSRFKEIFNAVQLLEFNWGQYEPDEGRPLLAERRAFIEQWCIPNGLTRFYGHMLVWTRQYDDYPRTGLPVWLFDYDKPTQYKLLQARIRREVSDYRDLDLVFDVVNEAVHCRVWGDWDKDSYVQNQTPEPLDRIVPYVRDALDAAHAANPEGRFLINDYRVIVEGRFRQLYRALIDRLLAEGAPLSAIGIQAHEPYKGRYWYSPEELWRTYDFFGKETGLPIYITEYWNLSDPREPIRGEYREGNWSEELQADAAEEFYRVSFGHPSIEAIFYFGMTDADVTEPSCGLLDEEYRPKPAWHRLKKLIWDEWTTETTGQTSTDGQLDFRGFFGSYDVVVAHGGEDHHFTVDLKDGAANRFNLDIGGGTSRD